MGKRFKNILLYHNHLHLSDLDSTKLLKKLQKINISFGLTTLKYFLQHKPTFSFLPIVFKNSVCDNRGIKFLVFDELLGSQDEERRFEIMEAFHTIKEQYRQIFLICHESETKEMFERVMEL